MSTFEKIFAAAEKLPWGIGIAVTLGTAMLGAVMILLVTLYLPPDYFRKQRRSLASRSKTLIVFKNLFGLVVLILGVAMLVLPGQGMLTILVALVLLDIPGKQRLERRIARLPRVLNSLNKIRRYFGKEDFLEPKNPST